MDEFAFAAHILLDLVERQLNGEEIGDNSEEIKENVARIDKEVRSLIPNGNSDFDWLIEGSALDTAETGAATTLTLVTKLGIVACRYIQLAYGLGFRDGRASCE